MRLVFPKTGNQCLRRQVKEKCIVLSMHSIMGLVGFHICQMDEVKNKITVRTTKSIK